MQAEVTGRSQRRRRADCQVAALLMFLLLPAAGCTERDPMPTAPTIGDAADSWNLVLQSIAPHVLYATWGMDADDMWAVGDQGLILHHDGLSTRVLPRVIHRRLESIDGAARDAAWAVSEDGEILHWDGRTWQLVWRNSGPLRTVCALAPDDVYVGGRSRRVEPWTASILHFDGRVWVDTSFAEFIPNDEIQAIWSPGIGWPLLARSANGLLYRLEAGSWQLLAVQRILDVAGDLVLTSDFDDAGGSVVSLQQLHADGSLELICTGPDLQQARLLMSSRRTVLGYSNLVARVDDCLVTPLLNLDFGLMDLAQPVLAAEQGRPVFSVGRTLGVRPEFHRLTWQDDLSLHATSLLAPVQQCLPQQLAACGTDLVFRDLRGNVWYYRDGTWRQLTTPIDVDLLHDLADGSLAVSNTHQIAVWHPDGSWTQLPPSPHPVRSWWIDHQLRARTILQDPVTQHMELWALDDAGWRRLQTLSEQGVFTRGPAGFAPDNLFLVVDWELLHHDGEASQTVPATRDLTFDSLLAGRHTGRLYLRGWDEEDRFFTGHLHEGHLTVQTQGHGWFQLHEVDADLTVCLSGWPPVLFSWTDASWTPMVKPVGAVMQEVWGHPDHGLVVIANETRIFQQALPELGP